METPTTKTELSLLLFIETAMVDHGGSFNPQHVNVEEFEILDWWKEEKYIDHGRIVHRDIKSGKCHWVTLTSQAFADAHRERIARSVRLYNGRRWVKTSEDE
jgi:hypothetical protein